MSLAVCCEGSDSFARLGREENCMIQVYRNKNKEGKDLNQSKEKRGNLRIDGWVVGNLTCVGLKNNWVTILKHWYYTN